MSKAARSVALGLMAILLLAGCRSLPRVPGLPFGPTATPRPTATAAPAIARGSPFPTRAPVMATPAPVLEETMVPEGEATALPAPPPTEPAAAPVPPPQAAASALPAAPTTVRPETAVPEGEATALPALPTTTATGTAAPLAQAPATAVPGPTRSPLPPPAAPGGPGGAPQATPAPSAPCTTTNPALELTASATRLQVGQLVTFTVTLRNRGCTGLGLPQYRIDQSTVGWPLSLEPVTSLSVAHELGIGSNHSDTDVFVMRAAYPGQTTINAFASFEIHEGYPEPAYWGRASTAPLRITVAR